MRVLADRLRRVIANHEFAPVGKITISAGVTEYRPAEKQVEMIARADEALYCAKTAGRNNVKQSELNTSNALMQNDCKHLTALMCRYDY